jgi:hypothetical protein
LAISRDCYHRRLPSITTLSHAYHTLRNLQNSETSLQQVWSMPSGKRQNTTSKWATTAPLDKSLIIILKILYLNAT